MTLITEDLYVLELSNSRFSSYDVVNVTTGKMLLELKGNMLGSPQNMRLIVDGKLFLQEDI